VKVLALAAGLVLAPAAASAGTLIAGAARDTDGFVVAGATVVAHSAAGTIVGRGTTAGDGTFAIDADGVPTTLDVSCRFCVSRHVVLTGEPPAIVVVRYAALRDRTPSTDDIAALPYDRIDAVASLVPYAVVTEYGISDRGLAAGAGATTIDGISYYRIADGHNFLNLVPAGSLDALLAAPAGSAARYGPPAQGGLFDAATLGDRGLLLRGGGDGGAGVLQTTGSFGAAALAESFDGSVIRRATGRFDAPLAGGSLSLLASAAENGTDATSGAALRFATGLRAADAVASISAGTSRSAAPPAFGGFAGGSNVRADAHLSGRVPNAWEVGARTLSASANGPGTLSGTQDETALYADARRDVAQTTLTAAVTLQSDVESAGAARWNTTAILPSLDVEQRLGGGFALHASTTAAIRDPYLAQLGGYVYEPAAAFIRSDVVDAGLSYSDDRRLRIDGVAYAQRAGDAASRINGFGLDLAWQLSPQLALRTWALAAFAGADLTLPPLVAYAAPPSASPLQRQVLWITYRGGLRIDVLDRGAGIDGSVGIPLGRAFTLVAGTFGRMPGRVITLELRALER